jgi:CRISPR-associated protein Csh1
MQFLLRDLNFKKGGDVLGFLNAVKELGQLELERYSGDGEFADIDSFLEMPMGIIEASPGAEDDKKQQGHLRGKEIWVCLDVTDPQAETLEVQGVKKIELADFWSGASDDLDDRKMKRRYLYRDPPGNNTTWHFSPVHKLGRGVKDGRKELLGKGGDWRSDKNSRFYKFYKSTLKDFEERAIFSYGAVDKIMDDLVERVDELASLWSESKSSYLLIVSPCDGDHFLYPVEVKSYLGYFRSRLAKSTSKSAKSGAKLKKHEATKAHECAICHSYSESGLNLDKVFAFATFDKKGFLPGMNNSDAAKSKVFPVCDQCYKLLSEGRSVIDRKFLDTQSIRNVRIYLIPELLSNNANLKRASKNVVNFLQVGLKNESFVSEKVLEQEDEIVFHFVFWEQNQAQERLLLMVEDVPPSRLKRIEELWKDSVQATKRSDVGDSLGDEGHERPNRSTLAVAISSTTMAITSLAGKNEGDKKDKRDKGETLVMKDFLLDIVGRLLKGDNIDVYTVKSLVTSRLQGLFADSDWVAKYGALSMSRLQRVSDFFYRVNEG